MSYYSRVVYPHGGSGTYAVTFPYLSQGHVTVYDNGNPYGGAITWVNASLIALTPDIDPSHTVEIRRETPKASPLVTFTPGALSSSDLNLDASQEIYVSQEIIDQLTAAGIGPGGSTGVSSWNGLTGAVSVPYVSSVNGSFGALTITASSIGAASASHTHSVSDITDFSAGVAASLQAGSNVSFSTTASGKLQINASGGGEGGGGGGGGNEPIMLSAFGSIDGGGVNTDDNDAAFLAAEAAEDQSIYIPDGIYKTTLSYTDLKKHYQGRGQIKTSDVGSAGLNWILPPNFSYIDSLPAGNTSQGNSGWFSGDQTFTDGGEWKILGPTARNYDLTQKYYIAQLTPHHAWLEVNSGNSGGSAFLTSGASAGQTVIPIHAPPSEEWVGKTVGFTQQSTVGGDPTSPVVETHVITAVNVAGKTITIDAPLTHTYTWNPAASLSPSIAFSGRTMTLHDYTKVVANAAGDSYGSNVRMNVTYVPKPSETHTYLAACAGQYGGDINFFASGNRATGWESQYIDNGYDVSAISQVDSLTRTNDECPPGTGRIWLGILQKSGGTRPIDAAYVWAGLARNGLDTVMGTFEETALLTAATTPSGNTITVNSLNGVVVGDPIWIGDGPAYTGTIQAIDTSNKRITVTPALPATAIPTKTIVKFTAGGAAINMAFGQRIVFNSSFGPAGRGGDPTGVFGTLYGNLQGDLIMETAADSTSEYWGVRYTGNGHGGSTARIRLRPNQFTCSVTAAFASTVQAGQGFTTNGSFGDPGNYPTVYFGNSGGNGNRVVFNTSLSRYEFYINNSLVAHIP